MTTSETIKEISTALVEFHKQVGKIKKDATNPFFKSKYADLSSILSGIDQPLTENGLAIVQFPEGEHELTTRLLHISGEWMEAKYTMRPTKSTPQDAGSAITYQRRYAIGAILSLNIDEDDDGNKASKQPENEWLNEGSEQFEKALEYLNNGGSITAIEKKYKVSKKVRELLLTTVNV